MRSCGYWLSPSVLTTMSAPMLERVVDAVVEGAAQPLVAGVADEVR